MTLLDQAIELIDEAREHVEKAKALEAHGAKSAAWVAEARRELARRLCSVASVALPKEDSP